MRVTLLHSPSAGDDDQPGRADLEQMIAAAGHEVRYHSLARSGWTRALRRRTDLIAVAGGDGSIGRVARHLLGRGAGGPRATGRRADGRSAGGRHAPIAVLPMDTANNVARTLGLHTRSLAGLVRSWDSGRRLAFDVGIARGPWGRRPFIEGAGFGLFSQALAREESGAGPSRAGSAASRLRRTIRMLRAKLRDFRPVRVQATLDGRDISGSYLLFEALIGHHVGPNLRLAPDAAFDDGLLDLQLVTEAERPQFLRALAAWQQSGRPRLGLRTERGRQLDILWTGFPLHIDDKSWPSAPGRRPRRAREVHVTVARKALTFLVPRRGSR